MNFPGTMSDPLSRRVHFVASEGTVEQHVEQAVSHLTQKPA
jgi:hypothetical protein